MVEEAETLLPGSGRGGIEQLASEENSSIFDTGSSQPFDKPPAIINPDSWKVLDAQCKIAVVLLVAPK